MLSDVVQCGVDTNLKNVGEVVEDSFAGFSDLLKDTLE